jgi:hypothetical protein
MGAAARFIWYIDADQSEINDTLRHLTGLDDLLG